MPIATQQSISFFNDTLQLFFSQHIGQNMKCFILLFRITKREIAIRPYTVDETLNKVFHTEMLFYHNQVVKTLVKVFKLKKIGKEHNDLPMHLAPPALVVCSAGDTCKPGLEHLP